MEEKRKEIRNSRGERIFDLVEKNRKLYLETYHKGKITRILLSEGLQEVGQALGPEERYELIKNLM